ncbi:MAG: hypothetical protein FD141_577 [Fusobacteria bacterium]|nr:MAG: hypothetical protein FD141_577 [Fusobacteriota bacterium]KAF0228757.1 MAG: hypothetical protein FD182_1013 [Fusobacteriota bacterium]
MKKFIKNSKLLIMIFIIGVILISLSACASKKAVVVVHKKEPQVLQTVSTSNALALRQFIFARLKTEEFLGTDLSSLQAGEQKRLIDELVLAWQTAEYLSSGAQNLADSAIAVLDTDEGKKLGVSILIDSEYRSVPRIGTAAFIIPMTAQTGRQFDSETWAENLTKKYDSIKGAKRYKQLADQLGTDTKSAVKQMALAQKIIHNIAGREEAQAEVDAYSKSLKIVQGYKSASKMGIFITGTIASGGGLGAISSSGWTLGQTAGVIISGTDAIVDIGTTGSSIILGENHQVTIGMENIKDKLAPVSSVVGLISFNSAETGEQLSYIGDTIADWYYDGKILGVKVTENKDGSTKVTALPLDISKGKEAAIKTTLETAGFLMPGSSALKGEELIDGYGFSPETAREKLESLITQMAEIMKSSGLIAKNVVKADISGTYQLKLFDEGKEETVQISILNNNDGTITWITDDGEETIIDYNEETGDLDYGSTLNLDFTFSGKSVTAKGNMYFWSKNFIIEMVKISD